MTRLEYIFGVASFAAIVAAAPAWAEQWFCKLQMSPLQNGWISPDIMVDINGDGSFIVQDRVMKAYGVDKVTPKVIENTDARVVLSWPVDATSDTGQIVRMAYRVSLYRDTKRVRLYGKDGAFANDFEGRGDCTVK